MTETINKIITHIGESSYDDIYRCVSDTIDSRFGDKSIDNSNLIDEMMGREPKLTYKEGEAIVKFKEEDDFNYE